MVAIAVLLGFLILLVVLSPFRHLAGWLTVGVAVVLATLAVPLLRGIRQAAAWEPAQIDLPHAPLLLGSTAEVPFRIRSKRRAAVAATTVTAHLTCVEEATVHQQDGSGVSRATVYRARLPVTITPTDHGVAAAIDLAIPVDGGGPTLHLEDNEIGWTLDVTVAAPNHPETTESFPLDVWATIDPALVDNIAAPTPAPRPGPHPAGPLGGRGGSAPLLLTVESGLVELGGRLRGQLIRTANTPTGSGLFVELRYRTHGDGTVISGQAVRLNLPNDTVGATAFPLEITVPDNVPISYDGKVIQVTWELRAAIDQRLRPDTHAAVPILVVPKGGYSLYRQPHPLRLAPGRSPWADRG
ncbi:MAG: hypothetical protein ACK5PP_18480 [Acidimicrobiales bacterium]